MMNSIETPNRVFKDRLFCAIFGREENKPFLLELYNALNGSNHTNLDDLEFTTIENAIYITMKNDVSFLIGSQLNLYEAQSSYNPNMPLRGLIYFAQLYQMYLNKNDLDFYSSKLVKIPAPKFVVFYNGKKELPDITKQKLSDAFETMETTQSIQEFEWTATVININKNHNSELLKSCKSLYHYCEFVSLVKENLSNGQDKGTAIKNNFLNGYFSKQKSEVLGMSLTEFNQEEYDRHRRREAFEDGEEYGTQQNKLQTARIALENDIPLEMIVKLTGLSIEEITALEPQTTNSL